jgi:hypothetical protein
MAHKIHLLASVSILRNRIRDHAPPCHRIPRPSTGTSGTHPANVCPADEQDVRPHDIRLNRNAAGENATTDGSPHSNLADRTEIFSQTP